MTKLTPEGEQIVEALAAQYKIGADAVKVMLDAVAKGGGGMAKFNLPEFGGAGEWMRGMALMGGMGGDPVKATVDGLCNELSNLMAAQASLFMPAAQWPASERWWPAELGEPSSAGSRASSRYAYFAQVRRLAVEFGRPRRGLRHDRLQHRGAGPARRRWRGTDLRKQSRPRAPSRLPPRPWHDAGGQASAPGKGSSARSPCLRSRGSARPEARHGRRRLDPDADRATRHAEGEGHTHRGRIRGQEGRAFEQALAPPWRQFRRTRIGC